MSIGSKLRIERFLVAFIILQNLLVVGKAIGSSGISVRENERDELDITLYDNSLSYIF